MSNRQLGSPRVTWSSSIWCAVMRWILPAPSHAGFDTVPWFWGLLNGDRRRFWRETLRSSEISRIGHYLHMQLTVSGSVVTSTILIADRNSHLKPSKCNLGLWLMPCEPNIMYRMSHQDFFCIFPVTMPHMCKLCEVEYPWILALHVNCVCWWVFIHIIISVSEKLPQRQSRKGLSKRNTIVYMPSWRNQQWKTNNYQKMLMNLSVWEPFQSCCSEKSSKAQR